jgi:hypothetical protein
MAKHRQKYSALWIFDISEFVHVTISALHGTVDRVVMHAHEKGLVKISQDEFLGFARNGVGEMLFFFDGLAVAVNGVPGIVTGFMGSHLRRIDRSAIPGKKPSLPSSWNHFSSQPGDDVVMGWGSIKMALMEETKEFIKPSSQGQVFGGGAKMPFAK